MARKRSNRLFVSLRKMTRNPQKAISSRADGIGETEGKAAMGGGEQAGKRVSFNPKSDIKHQTSNIKRQMVALSLAIRIRGAHVSRVLISASSRNELYLVFSLAPRATANGSKCSSSPKSCNHLSIMTRL